MIAKLLMIEEGFVDFHVCTERERKTRMKDLILDLFAIQVFLAIS